MAADKFRVYSKTLAMEGTVVGGTFLSKLHLNPDEPPVDHRYGMPAPHAAKLVKEYIGTKNCPINGFMVKVRLDNNTLLNTSLEGLTPTGTQKGCATIW